MQANNMLPVIEDWTKFSGFFFDVTANFPKSIRFSFTVRMHNIVLDIMEDLIDARYSPAQDKRAILRKANLRLEKLRILIRLCHENGRLAMNHYEKCALEIEKVGRQIGAWQKEIGARNEKNRPDIR